MKKVYVLLCTAIFMLGMGSLPAAAAAEPKSTMFVRTSDNGNAVQAVAALDITAEPDPVRPDEQLYYALTVSNLSNSILTGVVLDVLLPDYTKVYEQDMTGGGDCVGGSSLCYSGNAVRWQLGDLSPGEVRTVQMSPDVADGTPPDGTVLRAEATVYYDGGTATAVRDVVVDSSPSLSLSLTEDSDPVGPSDLLNYTLGVWNRDGLGAESGELVAAVPGGATFVSASDGGLLQGAEVRWSLGSLPSGMRLQRRFTVQTAANASNGELLTTEAMASGVVNGLPVVASGNAVTAVQATPALALNITAEPDPVRPDEQLYYALTVSNLSNSILTGVVLDVLLPDYTKVYEQDMTGGGDCVGGSSLCYSGNAVRWQLGDLSPGEVRTVQMSPDVADGTPPDGTVLRAEATVYYDGGTATAVRDVVVDSSPSLSLSLTEDSDPVGPSDLLNYTLGVWNRDGLGAESGELVAAVPGGATFVSASDGGLLQGAEVRWSLGSLPSGMRLQRRFTVQTAANASNGELLTTEAMASGVVNGLPVVASGNAVTAVQATPALTLNITAEPDPVRPDEQLYYALTVSNLSNSILTGVVLDVLLPDYTKVYEQDMTGGGDCVGGSSLCYSGNAVRWQLGDLSPGEVRTVQMSPDVADGTPPDGTVLRAEATVYYDGGTATAVRDVVVDSSPSLSLSLTEDSDPVGPSDLLNYTLGVWNRDGLGAENGELVAAVPGGATFVSASDGGLLQGAEARWSLGSLPSGMRLQRRFTVQTAANASNGELLTTEAMASGVVNGLPVVASGNAVTAVQATPALALNITAEPDPVRPDEQLYYALTVSNLSNSILTGVVLDVLLPDYTKVYEQDMTGGGDCVGGSSLCYSGNAVRWQLGDLSPGEVRTVQMSPDVTDGTPPDGTVLRAEATVYYDGGTATAVRDVVVGIHTSTTPTVTTTAASSIASTSASSGGNVISGGGNSVTARGVCWSTSANPTISNSMTSDGAGIGSFFSSITGLIPKTTYHVRAYATTSAGTGYGGSLSFKTSYVSTMYVSKDGVCGGMNPCYTSIQAAIDVADTGVVIRIAQGTYSESIILSTSISLILQGSWNLAFTSQTSSTSIIKVPKVNQGSLTIQEVVIKP